MVTELFYTYTTHFANLCHKTQICSINPSPNNVTTFKEKLAKTKIGRVFGRETATFGFFNVIFFLFSFMNKLVLLICLTTLILEVVKELKSVKCSDFPYLTVGKTS